MPKKIINVSNFSGGINKNTNPRDMVANEYQEMLNLDNEVPGKLKLYGSTGADANHSDTSIASVNHGNGLYHFNLDRNIANASIANKEYLAINNPAGFEVKVYDASSTLSLAKTVGYNATSATEVVMYNIDGTLRVIPKVGSDGTPKVLYLKDEDLTFGSTVNTDLVSVSPSYDVEDLFIAGLTGRVTGSDSNNLDPDKLYKQFDVFKHTRKSEVFMNTGYSNSSVTSFSSPNYSRYVFPLSNNHSYFTSYSEYDSAPYTTGRGGFHLMAYFSKTSSVTTNEEESTITVYPNKTSTGQDSEKRYGLWVSNIYEHIYESPAYFVGTIFQQDDMTSEVTRYLHWGIIGRAPETNKRITGYKIYWGLINNFSEPSSGKTYDGQVNAKYLFVEIDFHKGLRYAGEDTYTALGLIPYEDSSNDVYENWIYPINGYLDSRDGITLSSLLNNFSTTVTVNSTSNLSVNDIIKIDDEYMKITSITNATTFVVTRGYGNTAGASHGNGTTVYISGNEFEGKRITSLSTVEPYIGDHKSIIGPANTGFNTIAIANRRAYIGNVKYYNSENELVTKNDRIIKSNSNQFDYFEEDNFIDVEVEDGDYIVKLSTINQQLLEFKTRTLFIINVSRDIEYLEGTYPYKGCNKDYHVYEGEGFVTWFNSNGVYFYDGRQLSDIHLNENGQSIFNNWSTSYYHDDNVIGFIPKTKEIYIARPNNTILKFDLKSQSWTQGDNFGAGSNNFTNFVLKNDDVLTYYQDNGNNTITLKNWNPTPVSYTGSEKIILKTKEFDFGNPTANKNINTIYVNYRNGQNITVKGFGVKRDNVNNTTSTVDADIGSLVNTTNEFLTTKLAVSDTFKNLVSFGIALELNGASAADFELNDIQIVYRDKVYR